MHCLGVLDPRDSEGLLASVLEGGADKVGLSAVEDDEAVMECINPEDGEHRVLGVEDLDVFGGELCFGVGPDGHGNALVLLGKDVEGSGVGVAVYEEDALLGTLDERGQELEGVPDLALEEYLLPGAMCDSM